jgi:hypothetical protein
MKKICLTMLVILVMAPAVRADMPQVVWVGGGAQVSNEDRPGYTADTMISLGSYSGLTPFLNPMLTLKNSKVGTDIGLGVRLPIFSGQMIAGGNAFFDYTNDNNHRRVGLGAELFHPMFSGHVNAYLPLSDLNGHEEAVAGFDFNLGIPVPNAAFISIWPGFYYYNGHHEDDMKGLSFAIKVQPIEVLGITLGARNDAPAAGRDENEMYARIELTIPMSRLDKDLFSFKKGAYPREVDTQMADRVVREQFIAVEKPHR